MTAIKTKSGRTRRVRSDVNPRTIVGLDQEGRVVVREPWMDDYAFGLTLCCDAWDKGLDDCVVCRACLGAKSGDTGHYMQMADDGSLPGLDPVRSIAVPH